MRGEGNPHHQSLLLNEKKNEYSSRRSHIDTTDRPRQHKPRRVGGDGGSTHTHSTAKQGFIPRPWRTSREDRHQWPLRCDWAVRGRRMLWTVPPIRSRHIYRGEHGSMVWRSPSAEEGQAVDKGEGCVQSESKPGRGDRTRSPLNRQKRSIYRPGHGQPTRKWQLSRFVVTLR
jgi:hypothetical protein